MEEALRIHKKKNFESFMGVDNYIEGMEFSFEGEKGNTLMAFEKWKKNIEILKECKKLMDGGSSVELRKFIKKIKAHIIFVKDSF